MRAKDLKRRKAGYDRNQAFDNDADRIVHRHLQNKDDVITDEDLRNIRISTSTNEPTTTGAEAQSKFGFENPEIENGQEG